MGWGGVGMMTFLAHEHIFDATEMMTFLAQKAWHNVSAECFAVVQK